MGKHLVIAGHGLKPNGSFDPGATGFISKGEHKYMKEDLIPAIKKYLPKGHDVVFFDQYSVVSHGNLMALVKQYGADQVTELHFDATGSAQARGGHVIIHADYEPDKVNLAYRDAIKDMVGVRYTHRGHKGISGRTNLGNTNIARRNGLTYRLLELGFGTNKTDADIMVNQVNEYGRKLAEVLAGVEIDKKGTVKQPDSKTAGVTTDKPSKPKKSIDQLADEVIAGKHGTGDARKKSLGSQYSAVQKRVNKKLGAKPKAKPKPASKSIDQLVKETLAGKHGNGEARKRSLGKNYQAVQDVINGKSSVKAKSGKSISQMATEVIQGKHGSGHENRRKSLGISKAEYEKVRAEVNRLM